jgi:hypothetical protein
MNVTITPSVAGTDGIVRSAVFDATGRYRYRLSRDWGLGLGRCAFVMLNPSTADGQGDDPTIRRCTGFAKAWKLSGFDVVNLFAHRATRPEDLSEALRRDGADAVVGSDNAAFIRDAARQLFVVAAWGAHGTGCVATSTHRTLVEAGAAIRCLGVTKGGEPRHPLYVPRDSQLRSLIDYPKKRGTAIASP